MEWFAGSINGEAGVYGSLCCGNEIVLYAGATFPNCKKHQEIKTRWKQVGTVAIGPRSLEETGSGSTNGGASAARPLPPIVGR